MAPNVRTASRMLSRKAIWGGIVGEVYTTSGVVPTPRVARHMWAPGFVSLSARVRSDLISTSLVVSALPDAGIPLSLVFLHVVAASPRVERIDQLPSLGVYK